jgi:hypothetical protein
MMTLEEVWRYSEHVLAPGTVVNLLCLGWWERGPIVRYDWNWF